MTFTSTRGGSAPVTLSGAILEGIAPDGGLFVPERLPPVSLPDFPPSTPLAAIAERLIGPFAEGDPLAATLAEICEEAFDFPADLRERHDGGRTPAPHRHVGPRRRKSIYHVMFRLKCSSALARSRSDSLIYDSPRRRKGGSRQRLVRFGHSGMFHRSPSCTAPVDLPVVPSAATPRHDRRTVCGWYEMTCALAAMRQAPQPNF